MFKRIVQRNFDGKYAIKRWNLLFWCWEYQGMISHDYWWKGSDSNIDYYCWTDDYNLVLKLFNDTETVIKSK